MGTIVYIMRLSKNQLDDILDDKYLGTLMEQWRDTDHFINIDKAWHGIHYLLTNSSMWGPIPARWTIFGDIKIPEFEKDYVRASYLKPSQVSKVNNFLSKIPEEEFKRRYNPNKFEAAEIYPDSWDNTDIDYLMIYFRKVKILYQKAADIGEYVLLFRVY